LKKLARVLIWPFWELFSLITDRAVLTTTKSRLLSGEEDNVVENSKEMLNSTIELVSLHEPQIPQNDLILPGV
jgi:hypothetical protein